MASNSTSTSTSPASFRALADEFLREEFGTAWFTSRDAGSLLRELWSEGQRASADQLLHEVVGSEIELDAVHERVRQSL